MADLKPCPFCGRDEAYEDVALTACCPCSARGPEYEGVEGWNSRAVDPKGVERVAEWLCEMEGWGEPPAPLAKIQPDDAERIRRQAAMCIEAYLGVTK